MKLEKINDNKIRCILDQKDIEDRKILDNFINKNPLDIKGFFEQLLLEAQNKLDFYVGTSPITIQSNYTKDSKIEFIISKTSSNESIESLFNINEATRLSFIKDNIKNDNFFTAIEFKNIDGIYDFLISGVKLGRLNNTLYKNTESGIYILVLKPKNINKEKFIDLVMLLEEYGSPLNHQNLNESYIEEHFSPLIRKNALQTIYKTFI